jgi:hypothetical protein
MAGKLIQVADEQASNRDEEKERTDTWVAMPARLDEGEFSGWHSTV